MGNSHRASFATGAIAAASLLSACVTALPPEMALVRTDGRKIADDPGLLRQGKSDITTCSADLGDGMPTAIKRVHGR
jgi:hypothetical protein